MAVNRSMSSAVLLLALFFGVNVEAANFEASICALDQMWRASNFPEVMTVTNCHGCQLFSSSFGTPAVTPMLQGYNYPEVLGSKQQALWYKAVGTSTTLIVDITPNPYVVTSAPLGCGGNGIWDTVADNGLPNNLDTTDKPHKFFHSAYDGNRLERAVMSENYIKIYVNNGGYKTFAAADPDNFKSTIQYSLCAVASNGTETCPAEIVLGEFKRTDNPFILISNIPDGEYVLKVYSTVTTCNPTTDCPTVKSDSNNPLRVPFIVMTSAPTLSFTSSERPYITADSVSGSVQFKSDAPSRYSGTNTDTKFSTGGDAWAVYHSLFQVMGPGSSTWGGFLVDNNDGKSAYTYDMSTKSQGTYSLDVLNVLVSNHTSPGTPCSSATCSLECPSMCLSDFSGISGYMDHAIYSAPISRSFVYDSIPPTIFAGCKGSSKCEGQLFNSRVLQFEFSCTDTNAPCKFYCGLDGKPTLDTSTVSSLRKGYLECTSPTTVTATASGTFTFTVYAVDAAGNMGDLSKPFSFYVDKTAPAVQFSGVAKRCLVDEKYFVPDLSATGSGPADGQNIQNTAANPPDGTAGVCVGDRNQDLGNDADANVAGANVGGTDNKISNAYGSPTCTCGTYEIETSANVKVQTYNQNTYPSLMSADSDSSLNARLGYYPKTVPDKGIYAVSQGETETQHLINGVEIIKDTDGNYDFVNNFGQGDGKVLYDVGVASDTSDDISKTKSMYDTVVQVPMDITREVYNLNDGEYGAVLASKRVNDGNYYYHVLESTNSPTATVNMQCVHPEILNCAQSAQNPFQMDCGQMIT